MLFVIFINGIAQMIEIKSKESEEWGHVIFWKKEKGLSKYRNTLIKHASRDAFHLNLVFKPLSAKMKRILKR